MRRQNIANFISAFALITWLLNCVHFSEQNITTHDLRRDITRVVTDEKSDIYVGGVNFVAQFTNKLEDLILSISIGPVYNDKDCAPNRAPCNNTVRVLELIKELGLLLVCGTAYNGTCTLHSMVDLTDWFCLVGNIDPDAAVFTSHVNQTTVVHLLPPTDDISSPTSQSTGDDYECRHQNFSRDFFNFANNGILAGIQETKISTFRNKLVKRSNTTPSQDWLSPTVRVMVAGNIQRSDSSNPIMLSMRSIRFSENNFFIDYVNDPETQKKGIDIDPSIRSNFSIDYKFSFTWANFSYFLTVQEDINGGEKKAITKLSRVPNNSSQIVPFVEVTLECDQNRTTHRLATTATFVQTDFPLNGTFVPIPVLLVAFGRSVTPQSTTADPSKGGSLCAFFIDDLAKNDFEYALNNCNEGDDMLSEPPYWITGASKICQSVNLTGQKNPYVKSIFEVSFKSLLNVSTFINTIYSYVPKISNNPDSKYSNIIDLFFTTGTGSMENMNLQVSMSDKPVATVNLLVNMDFPFGKEMMEQGLTPVGFVDDLRTNLYLAVGSKIMRMSVNFCRQFPNCEECMSSHEVYTCKWCSRLNICQDSKLTCNGRDEGTCPPKLEKFSPEFFPTEGGSLLTLDIANYRMPPNDTLKVNVTICDQPCELNSTKQSPITCIVPPCRQCKTTPKECNVTVKLEQLEGINITLSSFSLPPHPTFKYVSPKGESFLPHHGPIFGGTLLEVKGDYLRSGTKRRITVAGINCVIQDTPQNMNLIRCHTGKQSGKPLRGVVTVHIDKFQQNVSKTNFTYKTNPVITSTKPGNTIQSGGTDVIVTGTNLSSAAFSELVIFYNDTLANKSFVAKGQCFSKNNTQMRCVTPNVYNITSPYFTKHTMAVQIEAQMSIEMDGHDMVASVRSLSKKLMIHRDPDFHSITSQDDSLSAKYPNITIWGKNVPVWMDKHEIKVMVGGVPCPVKVVFPDHLVCNAHSLVEKVRREKNQTKSTHTNEDTTDMTTVWATTNEPVDSKPNFVDMRDRQSTRNTSIPENITAYTSAHHSNTSTTTLTSWTLTPVTVNDQHFDHVVEVQIGNYRKKVDSVRVSLVDPEDVQQSKIKMYIGAGVAGLLIVMLLGATVTLLIRVKRSKASKAGGVTPKPTLKQILESVVEVNKREDMDKIIVTLDRLTVGRSIGSGNFGCVYEGMLEIGSGIPARKVAIKTLQDPLSHNLDLLGFVQEACIMREFRHPNVLGLVGLAEKEPGVPYVILPFMERGDLLTYIRNAAVSLSLHDVIKFGADIANGMAYLSALKLVHRDLAARNCMLDDELRVKVADFGLCRDIYEKGYYTSDNKKKLPIRWMALESIEHGAYSTKSDVWSLGVVLWELLTRGVVPYPGVDGWDIINFLRHRRLAPPHFCPDALYSLMMLCWAKDPNKRPSFKTLQMELSLLIGQGPQDTPAADSKRESAVNVYVKMPSDRLDPTEDFRSSKAVKDVKAEAKDSSSENLEEDVKTREPVLEKKTSNVVKPIPKIRVTKAGLKKNPLPEGSEQSASSGTNKTQTGRQDRSTKTFSDILSVPTMNVVNNVMITIPVCYNHRDVSKNAAGVYIQLVDNYEPPPKFFSPFHKSSKRTSKKAVDKRTPGQASHTTGSDAHIDKSQEDLQEFVKMGKDGAYFELESKAQRLSAISDTGSRSSATMHTASSFGSLMDNASPGSSNRVSSGGSNLSLTHGQTSRVASQNMQVTYKRSPLADKSLSASCDLNISLNHKENPP